jgi:hypothetical protein
MAVKARWQSREWAILLLALVDERYQVVAGIDRVQATGQMASTAVANRYSLASTIAVLPCSS